MEPALVRDDTVDVPTEAEELGPVRLSIDPRAGMGLLVEVLLRPGADLVLGRSELADVQVVDPTVSGRHCRIRHLGTALELTDLGAANGVVVSGMRVGTAFLSVGSTWEMGRTRVLVVSRNDDPLYEAPPLPGLVGQTREMRQLSASVRKVSALRLPVLLRGESGTGKDLVARAIHEESPRSRGPFVAINAATISRELAESELFGHVRGAFTGASRDRRGAFREAHGGTLFLDEIGSIPLEVQAKLLRVVEEGIVRPLGAETGIPVDVRVIAATCDPIEAMVADRRFRADLYERIAVSVVSVPALRDRRDDIPLLAEHLLAVSEIPGRTIGRDAQAALRAHRWPGNVRELRNVVVQAAMRTDKTIGADHIAAVLSERYPRSRRLLPNEALRVFEETFHNASEAARRAGIPRSTMRDLLRLAGVHVDSTGPTKRRARSGAEANGA